MTRSSLSLVALFVFSGCSHPTGLQLGEERIDPDEPRIEAKLIELTEQVSLDRKKENGQAFVHRFNQAKSIACLDAQFVVPQLPSDLAVGLFATPATYRAQLRLANATEFDDTKADLRGLSIKVLDVPGAVDVNGATAVQDFTLNNYPALLAGTPQDFLDFVQATADGSMLAFFANPFHSHLRSLAIVLRARSKPATPFEERYFSTTPYRHGAAPSAVKYSVRRCQPKPPPDIARDADFLRTAVQRELDNGGVCLAFAVQFQNDPERMPIEDASVTWPEDLSPFRDVAEIHIGPQEFTDTAAMASCEALQFNPWNTLPAHQPLGGINRVRKGVYEALAKFRSTQNAAQTSE